MKYNEDIVEDMCFQQPRAGHEFIVAPYTSALGRVHDVKPLSWQSECHST